MAKAMDLTGQRFGKLVAIKQVEKPDDVITRGVYWLCQCDCGNKSTVCGKLLKNGGTKSCGCMGKNNLRGKKKRFSLKMEARKKPDTALNYLYLSYRHNAKNRNIEFNIDKETFRNLTKQDCHYCGELPSNDVKMHNGSPQIYIYNGIDRVDNNLGYIDGNVVPCCKTCNYIKKAMTQEELFKWVEKVYNHSIKKQ